MDRVGFEPTTSAIVSKPALYDFLFKGQSTIITLSHHRGKIIIVIITTMTQKIS